MCSCGYYLVGKSELRMSGLEFKVELTPHRGIYIPSLNAVVSGARSHVMHPRVRFKVDRISNGHCYKPRTPNYHASKTRQGLEQYGTNQIRSQDTAVARAPGASKLTAMLRATYSGPTQSIDMVMHDSDDPR